MSEEEKYKKAINELADSYELHLKQWAKRCIDTINEYTTDLQQENKQLKEKLEKAIKKVKDISFKFTSDKFWYSVVLSTTTDGQELLKILGDKE